MSRRKGAYVALLVCCCITPPAAAAVLDGQWRTQCVESDAPSGRSCAVLAAKAVPGGGGDFVQILVSPASGDGFTLLVRPNDGRASACALGVDGAAPVRSATALGGACLFEDAGGALVGLLRRGDTLRLTVRSADGGENAVTFALDGFAGAVDAARR